MIVCAVESRHMSATGIFIFIRNLPWLQVGYEHQTGIPRFIVLIVFYGREITQYQATG